MFKRALFLAFVGAVLAGAAFAQTSASANATVNILSGISIAKDRDLSFGNILGGFAGTMALTSVASPTPSYTGSLTASQVFGSPASAMFTVSGDGGRQFSVTGVAGGEAVTLNRAGGGSISVTLTAPSCTTPCTLSGSTGTTGTLALYVGGTLTLTGAEVAGTYTAANAMTLTVNYN